MPYARFIVAGQVQGVVFRASARDEAVRLGLTGYAKNLADGSVEVLASGGESALAALERWLRIGPPAARVASVTRTAVEIGPTSGFRVF